MEMVPINSGLVITSGYSPLEIVESGGWGIGCPSRASTSLSTATACMHPGDYSGLGLVGLHAIHPPNDLTNYKQRNIR